MMASHPLFGTGWGDFFHDYQRLKLLVNDEAPHTPHNMITLFGSQCGIAAFLNAAFLLILPLVLLFRRLLKDPPDRGDIMPYALFCALAAAFTDFMLEITYETPAFLCTYAILVLLAFQKDGACGCEEDGKTVSPVQARLLRTGLAVFALLSAAGGALMMRSEQAFSEFQEALDPRFSRAAIGADSYAPPPRDLAIRLLRRATDLDPYNPFPWATASAFMAAQGDYAAAEGFISEAIKRSPLRSSFYLRRAKIRYAAKADPARVKADLDKVRELFPMNGQYRVPDSEILQQNASF